MLDSALVVDLGRQALWMTMLISAQTLSFIPKLVAMGVTLALAGGWMINTMVDYTRVLFGRIPTLFG